MVRGLGSLLAIAIGCALLLGLTHRETSGRIEHNQNEKFRQQVNELTAIDMPANQVNWNENVWHLCNGMALVRGETRGYGGPVHLLAALNLTPVEDETHRMTVRGLAITSHQETPGIADFIAQPEHGWLQEFVNLDVDEIDQIDAVTGATITSRAILKGVRALTKNSNLNMGCSR